MVLKSRKKTPAPDSDKFVTTPLPPQYCDSRTSAFKVLFQNQNAGTAKILGITTLAMMFIPVMAFYLTMNTIFAEHEDPTMYAGFAAVLAVNLVLGGYVVFAFSEKDPESEEGKVEERPLTASSSKTRTD